MGSILKSKLFWVLAALLLLFGLYVVLGFYAAPRIVRSQAVDFVREKYGRELSIGEIKINPLKLQAEISDLSLPDKDGQPMLAFRRLFVDFEASSLWQRAFEAECPGSLPLYHPPIIHRRRLKESDMGRSRMVSMSA